MFKRKVDAPGAGHKTLIDRLKAKVEPYLERAEGFLKGVEGHTCAHLTFKGVIDLDKAIEGGKVGPVLKALKEIIPPDLMQQIIVKPSATIAPAAVAAVETHASPQDLVVVADSSALQLVGDAGHANDNAA